VELHEALSHIAEIRTRVAATQRFRGYRAVPVATSGVLAVIAAAAQPWVLAKPGDNLIGYLGLWVAAAVLGAAASASGILLRYRAGADSPLARELTRLAVGQFAPCVAAGALVTLVIVRHAPDVGWVLPGLWQVLFSLGVFASCRLLPRAIVGVGAFYLLAGAFNLTHGPGDAAFSPWVMGVPFGVGQLCVAAILYWNLERNDADHS
jgi:hypothetical protein